MDASGKLSFLNRGEPIISAEEVPNPSYLCILLSQRANGRSGGNRHPALRDGGLCVVSELREGKLQSYAVKRNRAHGAGAGEVEISATAVGTALDTGGASPCHVISTDVGDDKMECIIVCNYGEDEGVLTIFGFDKDAIGTDAYSRQTSISFGPGSNVDRDRQKASHAHSSSVVAPISNSSSMDLCCADLGSDAIVQFSMTSTTDNGRVSLQCLEKERLAAPPGSGPRSLMINPIFENTAIVSLELTAQVWLIQRRVDDGRFVALGEPMSLLPENWPGETELEYQFNRGRWASDAVWSPCGMFAYAAARLHNSISVFQVQLTTATESSSVSKPGEIVGLTLIQRISTNGITPRCLCMSECGLSLLVAHQHSHDISSFRRNETDGTIQFIDRLEVPNAACVKLIRPDQIG